MMNQKHTVFLSGQGVSTYNGVNETWVVRIHVQAFINKQSKTQAGSINSKQVWHGQDTE